MFVMCGLAIQALHAQTITSVSPNTAQQGASLTVTITGANTNFGSGTSTKLAFSQGTKTIILPSSIAVNSGTSMDGKFNIPTNAPTGFYLVTVIDGADGTIRLAQGFEVTSNAPQLVSTSPTQAKQGQSLTVTVTGQNTHFGQGTGTMTVALTQGSSTIITAGSVTVNSVTSADASFSIPSSAATGLYNVVVNDPVDGKISLANYFKINSSTATIPTLTSVSPDSGGVGQLVTVTITGKNTNFSAGTNTVTFTQGSNVIKPIYSTVASNTSIQSYINIPATAALGLYDVAVTNSTDGTVTLAKSFKIYNKPPAALVSISPNSGQQGQTLTVTITGQNTSFDKAGLILQVILTQGTSTITPTTTKATSATTISCDFTFKFTDKPGKYDLNTISLQDGYLTKAACFTLYAGIPPTITSFTPDTGSAGNKSTVTVTANGTHFDPTAGKTTVWIALNGTKINAGTVTVYSPTSLSAVINVPSNAAAGNYSFNVADATDGTVTATKPMQISSTSGIGQVNEIFGSITAFPNPFSNNISLNMDLRQSGKINLDLYDISGREIATLYEGTLMSGNNKLTLDLASKNLKPGIYMLKASSASGASSIIRLIKY